MPSSSALRFATDENFNGHVLRGLQRRLPFLDIVRLQESLPEGTSDEEVLEWAAAHKRILLTHDYSTLIGIAYERLRGGLKIAGVIAVQAECPIGRAIEDLFLLAAASESEELADRILYIPL